MRAPTASFILLIASLLALAGCGGDAAAPDGGKPAALVHQVPAGTTLKLAFVTNTSSEFWKIAEQGLEKANRELGIHVEMKIPEHGKLEQQKKIIEDLVSQGYHGIAISLVSPADEVRDLDRAAARLNVITHDSDAPQSKRLAYIGTDNYAAGRIFGGELKKLLPKGGKVAAFVGSLAAESASVRLKGITDALAGSGIEIAVTREDANDMTKARTNVEDTINARPDVAAYIGLWSYNTPAIVAALKASGKADRLIAAGFDEEEGTLQGIADGIVSFTVVQKPFEFGYRSAKLLYALATQGAAALPADPIIDTGVEVISKGSVAEFRERLAVLKR